MNDKPDKVSLMFLSPDIRAKVWKYIEDYGLPYPVNGLVNSFIVRQVAGPYEFQPEHVYVEQTGSDWERHCDRITGSQRDHGPMTGFCTCTKPFGGPVIKCPHCRKTDPTGYRALICKNSLKDEPVKCADLDTSGYTEKPPTPTTEYRRWKCDNKGCFLLWPVVSSDEWETAYGVSDEKNVHCFCKGRLTVITCDRDGRELSPTRPAKRYFKSQDGFSDLIRMFDGDVIWLADKDNPSFDCRSGYDVAWCDENLIEIPEQEALALLAC